jgi:adenosylhomocysteinase
VLPKELDEKVARCTRSHRREATTMTADQERYLGISAAGPFKPEHYRY